MWQMLATGSRATFIPTLGHHEKELAIDEQGREIWILEPTKVRSARIVREWLFSCEPAEMNVGVWSEGEAINGEV